MGEIDICRRNTVMPRYWVNKCHSGFNEDRMGEYILTTWVTYGEEGGIDLKRGNNAQILG